MAIDIRLPFEHKNSSSYVFAKEGESSRGNGGISPLLAKSAPSKPVTVCCRGLDCPSICLVEVFNMKKGQFWDCPFAFGEVDGPGLCPDTFDEIASIRIMEKHSCQTTKSHYFWPCRRILSSCKALCQHCQEHGHRHSQSFYLEDCTFGLECSISSQTIIRLLLIERPPDSSTPTPPMSLAADRASKVSARIIRAMT